MRESVFFEYSASPNLEYGVYNVYDFWRNELLRLVSLKTIF